MFNVAVLGYRNQGKHHHAPASIETGGPVRVERYAPEMGRTIFSET